VRSKTCLTLPTLLEREICHQLRMQSHAPPIPNPIGGIGQTTDFVRGMAKLQISHPAGCIQDAAFSLGIIFG